MIPVGSMATVYRTEPILWRQPGTRASGVGARRGGIVSGRAGAGVRRPADEGGAPWNRRRPPRRPGRGPRCAPSTRWWSGPGSPASTCCTGCATSRGSTCRCSTRRRTWAGRGGGTATRVPAATSSRSTTPTPSTPSSSRSGPGASATPPSPRSCATPTTSPTATTCAATSSSTPGSPRRTWQEDDAAVADRDRPGRRPLGAVPGHGRRAASRRPRTPRSPGSTRFAGPDVPHRALAPRGRRLQPASGSGVIGTGSSGIQSIPLIARAGRPRHGLPAHRPTSPCRP